MPTGEDLTTGQLIECMRVLKVIQNNSSNGLWHDTLSTVIDLLDDELEILKEQEEVNHAYRRRLDNRTAYRVYTCSKGFTKQFI